MNQKNALFGALDAGPTIASLSLEEVRPDPGQPRKSFDEEALKELASSIEEHGLVQPIVVRRDPETPGKYLIIAGERRYRAVRSLGRPTIDAIVRDEKNAAVVAIVENLQRVDLSPVEEAEAISRLIDDLGISQGQVAKLLGKSRGNINQLLAIVKLPPAVRAEAPKADVAKSILIELAQLGDEATQQKLWQRAKAGNLTVAEVRRARKSGEEKPVPAEDGAQTGAEEGVRRRTGPGKALGQIKRAIETLANDPAPLSEEDRAEVRDLINQLNALAVTAPNSDADEHEAAAPPPPNS